MTRDDYRRITVALNRPHTLRLIHKDSPNIVVNIYHSCQELQEYHYAFYRDVITFLDYVLEPWFLYENGEEVDFRPF